METLVFLGFGIDAWITIVTILAMFSVMLFISVRSFRMWVVLQYGRYKPDCSYDCYLFSRNVHYGIHF